MIRIGWLSPLTPKSGVGTFTHALSQQFPREFDGEKIDLTLLYTANNVLYASDKRVIEIQGWEGFENILGLFDIVVYNIGNNSVHHDDIFRLARRVPGIIVFHDYVYQHYVADQCLFKMESSASYASLLLKFGTPDAINTLRNSRITSRVDRPIYGPWDTEFASQVPMSAPFAKMGSAVVVHSQYAKDEVQRHFSGPVLKLGMPFDQKSTLTVEEIEMWKERVAISTQFKALFFGHIIPTKSLDLVLEAIADSDFLRTHLKLVIAGFPGAPAYIDQLRSTVSGSRLESVVTFEFDVSERRLKALSDQADLFINLRYPNTEGASVSLVEQMAAGKPVVVYNSGCYAEVPDDGAIKISAIGSSDAIRLELEAALARPENLISIGTKARQHVIELSCSEYVRRFLTFVREHKGMLQERTRLSTRQLVAYPTMNPPIFDQDTDWLEGLADTRLSFDLLDRGLAPIDPSLIFSLSNEDLAAYIAIAILGTPRSDSLLTAVTVYLETVSKAQIFWDISFFHLLAAAIFDKDESAIARLRALGPITRLDLWKIVSELPSTPFRQAASLMLTGNLLDQAGSESASADAASGFPPHLRIASDIEKHKRKVDEQHWAPIIKWLETVLPDIPSANFRDTGLGQLDLRDGTRVGLLGVYDFDDSGVWTQGTLSFVAMAAAPFERDVEIKYMVPATEMMGPQTLRFFHLGAAFDVEDVVVDNGDVQTAKIRLAEAPDYGAGHCPAAIIAIESDFSICPSELGINDDNRDLGVQIFSVKVHRL